MRADLIDRADIRVVQRRCTLGCATSRPRNYVAMHAAAAGCLFSRRPFSSDGKSFLYLVASRIETTVYRQPWQDGKLTGPAQPAVKLPFAFWQGYAGNSYDFSKLSTVIYARPGGQADLYFLSQK